VGVAKTAALYYLHTHTAVRRVLQDLCHASVARANGKQIVEPQPANQSRASRQASLVLK
jgi:hypothetical protein